MTESKTRRKLLDGNGTGYIAPLRETDGASLQVAKLELDGKPVGKYPHSGAAHTDGQSTRKHSAASPI